MDKSIFLTVSMILCTSVFVGCSQDESVATISDELSVKAGHGMQSRTSINDDNQTVVWSKNDKIYLFGGNANATLSLKSGENETEGTFSGVVNGFVSQLTTALYPVPTVDGDQYTYEFPAEITYSSFASRFMPFSSGYLAL